jgi:hypothetical protein
VVLTVASVALIFASSAMLGGSLTVLLSIFSKAAGVIPRANAKLIEMPSITNG